MKITKEFLRNCQSISGLLNDKQLDLLGIKYPLKAGWKKLLIGKDISDEVAKNVYSARQSNFQEKKEKERAYEKKVNSSAIPWYLSSRLRENERIGLNLIDQICLALEKDGIICPMTIRTESLVRENFSHICREYQKLHPLAEKFNPLKRTPAKVKKVKSKIFIDKVDVTTTEFLFTYAWRKLRMEALKKYGSKCMCCGASPATGAVMNVDHIKPRKHFPSLALNINNLQILCHDCNHGKGNWDQTDWRK